jgi:hypothetical protein
MIGAYNLLLAAEYLVGEDAIIEQNTRIHCELVSGFSTDKAIVGYENLLTTG